ncbi:uncharacterized protein C4orf19 homolog [Anolis carolinensis]|uniref:Uncharacterized protein n=1 Tax=Anolis carolinensis TaxID=28377 RepID=H9GC66_ANOCA|nr:PREDICTED: uncharacterized protein C4orf19 homolog [Anolis carolinensis]|eukprot:XP_003226300.1 PREDICTED: uncharacterized protein C4orf19 homolog [Anolis carolinensis]
MGCRCCKMIQSYIFDPQEVQTSEYISEINNYKFGEQDRSKFKIRHNNNIQVQKNELQNSEVQPAANRNKLNNTKDATQNHREAALLGEGLGNSTAKCNGIHSSPVLNKNQSKEVNSTQRCSSELSDSSDKRVSQSQTCDNHETQKTEGSPELSLGTAHSVHHVESQCRGKNTASTQGVIQNDRGIGTHQTGPNDPGDVGKLIAVRSKSPLSHHAHAEQSTECMSASRPSKDLTWESKSCNLGEDACRTGLLNPCFEDQISSDPPSPCTKADVASENKYDGHEEAKGEPEDDDADVAEALAALEAATAGEDSEEEEEGY